VNLVLLSGLQIQFKSAAASTLTVPVQNMDKAGGQL